MSILEFKNKYKSNGEGIASIIKKWKAEKVAEDFLGSTVFGTVVLGDLVTGGHIFDLDRVPPEIVKAMKNIFSNKVQTLEDAKAFLADKILTGEPSISGTINAIQGRLGEYHFQKGFGDYAHLAGESNQAHFDVKITLPDEPVHYVQVKVYKDSDGALSKLKDLNEALVNEEIVDGAETVKTISFAVNDDLVDELSTKASELGSNINVIPIGAHYDQIREAAESSVLDHEAYLDDFFEGLLGGFVIGASLHAGVNGFLVYRGHKSLSEGIEDTVYSSIVTGGGVGAALSAEMATIELLGVCSGPVGFCIALGAGVTARSILKRFADRRHYAARMEDGNLQIIDYFDLLSGVEKSA